ncbi:HalOD1 output domain-containing protein [Candidatus Halobonum tyrrellensis]|uniref:Halobacterial output domain-containing protein n=1 Tax=Candidatus Halobonum tyrrellensis G22 TaxID=1324957 RepID=V4HQD8_9EURY|nr:HalOD1 output domain-containing protein [Candidatus Halobonum tyrrellensis]ESP90134.1 hypothetical protein K933_01197 [Candidatus Halobonum tyrrellensis G22]
MTEEAAGTPNATRSGSVQRQYDPDGSDGLTAVVVSAIAEAEGVRPMDVHSPPLYERFDVTSLGEAFFEPTADDTAPGNTNTVEFAYNEYFVQIRSDGTIQVFQPSDPSAD